MKIVLKDKQEIEVTSVNFTYNNRLDESERNVVNITIQNPNVTTEDVLEKLTSENLKEVQFVSNVKDVTKNNLTLINITENISDDSNCLDIRLAE